MLNPRLNTLITLILLAAATRVIPHPPNITSLTAVALFGGAYFSNRWLAFAIPLMGLLLSDALLGFYPHMWITYSSFALIVCIGLRLQGRRTATRIASAALISALAFFIVSNFGVWAFDSLYPKTLQGLISCYIAGVPFFLNSLLGDLFYTTILFGGFRLLEKRLVALREACVAISVPAS